MSRLLFALMLGLFLIPEPARAHSPTWSICDGREGPGGPELAGCRPPVRKVDPQGREIWITTRLARPEGDGPLVLRITGMAASRAWLNGVPLGENGRPGSGPGTEQPGGYEAAFHIRPDAWTPGENVLTLRLSSFHGGSRLVSPIMALKVSPVAETLRQAQFAVTFILLGILAAGAFGFGVVHRMRRTASSRLLMGMAGAAALLAALEALPFLIDYPYPWQVWRLAGLWAATVGFSLALVAFCTLGVRAPTRDRLRIAAAAGMALISLFAPLDLKTWGVLGVGALFALTGVALGSGRRLSRGAILYGGAAFVLAAVSLIFFAEVFHLLLIASLLLPLLMKAVIRLGRDDLSRETALNRAASPPDRLAIASTRGVEIVAIADIVAITGTDDYAEVRLIDGRRLLHAARLEHLADELPDGFMRVHRSAIANLAHARALEREGARWTLRLSPGESVKVSRARLDAIKAALAGPAAS